MIKLPNRKRPITKEYMEMRITKAIKKTNPTIAGYTLCVLLEMQQYMKEN